ncbi:ribosome assembly factor SBDS [archaeon CG07_land_8_20_14_0_80_38_8]|nr:MAG: ribosome assembly factor SBDS [archaeon CG07_land_8_20_14_0_80_38_8]
MRRVFEQKKKTHHYAVLEKDGKNFEVLINPDGAVNFRKGKTNDVNEALEIRGIFSDARSGDRAADLEKHFGTDNENEIAGIIIMKGEIRLTSEYRKKLQDEKRKEIINIIATNGTDPRTKLPIPVSRIELALENVHFNFDPFKSAEEQVEPLLNILRPVLPISFEEKIIEGFVPAKFAGKANGLVAKYGKIIRSEWKTDGSWSFEVRMPGGLQNEFIKEINNLTHGDVNISLR